MYILNNKYKVILYTVKDEQNCICMNVYIYMYINVVNEYNVYKYCKCI